MFSYRMFKGKKIYIKKAIISDWIIKTKCSSEGFRVPCLDQSLFKCYFSQTRTPEYPAVKKLPLPSNIEDLVSSEKLKFSPQRSREISGSYIKFSILPITKFTETNSKIYEDERVQCYDCSGTINLSSAMQTNVPFPFSSRGKPTHLNMPGGQWAQNEKYTSEDLHNLHHLNSKDLITKKGTSLFFKQTKNNFLCFSAVDFKICDSLQYGFSFFNHQLRNFSSQKEKMENFDKPKDKKTIINEEVSQINDKVSQLTLQEKLKVAIRDYGSVILIFHVGFSLFSLGCCYILISSGVDLGSIFKDWGVEEGATAAGTAAQFVVAYAVHKSLAPARIAVTLSVAPLIVRKLRKMGLLKSPKIKIQ